MTDFLAAEWSSLPTIRLRRLERPLTEIDKTADAGSGSFTPAYATLTTAATREMVSSIIEQGAATGKTSTRALAAQSTTKLLLTLGIW